MVWLLGCLMKCNYFQVVHDSHPPCAAPAFAYLLQLLTPPPQLSQNWGTCVLFASTAVCVLCAHSAGAGSSRP